MRKSTLVLSAALAAMAASSSWFWTQWQDERALNLDLRARADALARRDEHPLAAPVAASSDLPPARATKAAAEPLSVVAASTPPANYPRNVQQRLLKNPRFRQALRNQQRQVMETELRDLPKFLNLSPEDADHLLDLLAEQGVRTLELQWREPRGPEDGKSRQAALDELRTQNDAELTKLLGGPNMNRMQDFRSTFQSRAEVNSVRAELAMGSDPLRDDQLEPMVTLVDSELQRMKQELRDTAMAQQDPATRRSELAIAANQRIVDAATPILTSVQLAALKDLYRRQRLQMEADTELNRLQNEALLSDAQADAPNGASGQQ
ncbi:MAG TPA: hypothetical protein VGO61_08910 [Steroidobacteraceae bacterium]|nr:hypothetical protein [Steroidobacteraceae bacterium]